MATTSQHKQYLRAKSEVEASMASARALRDKWLAASIDNQTNVTTNKDLAHLNKALRNKLLTVKWDCEDLEETIGANEHASRSGANQQTQEDRTQSEQELEQSRAFIGECREEIATIMSLLEETDSHRKLYQKHGITLHNTLATCRNADTNQEGTQANVETMNQMGSGDSQHTHERVGKTSVAAAVTSMIAQAKSGQGYERLAEVEARSNEDDGEDVQFDKRDITTNDAANIYTNAQLDQAAEIEARSSHNLSPTSYYSDIDKSLKSFSSTQVFNNLSRPVTANVYMNPNDSETILDMLETEYYYVPPGMHIDANKNTMFSNTATRMMPRLANAMQKMLKTDGSSRFLGTIAFLFSFPLVMLILLML